MENAHTHIPQHSHTHTTALTHTHHLLFHSLHNALGFLNIALYHHRVSLWNILAAEVKLKERERGREAVKEEGGGG